MLPAKLLNLLEHQKMVQTVFKPCFKAQYIHSFGCFCSCYRSCSLPFFRSPNKWNQSQNKISSNKNHQLCQIPIFRPQLPLQGASFTAACCPAQWPRKTSPKPPRPKRSRRSKSTSQGSTCHEGRSMRPPDGDEGNGNGNGPKKVEWHTGWKILWLMIVLVDCVLFVVFVHWRASFRFGRQDLCLKNGWACWAKNAKSLKHLILGHFVIFWVILGLTVTLGPSKPGIRWPNLGDS